MTKQTVRLQEELLESGLLEPVSLNGITAYKSTGGESKNVVSLDGKPIGILCGDNLYRFDSQTPSGLYIR